MSVEDKMLQRFAFQKKVQHFKWYNRALYFFHMVIGSNIEEKATIL